VAVLPGVLGNVGSLVDALDQHRCHARQCSDWPMRRATAHE
jgi:hypothetical protein